VGQLDEALLCQLESLVDQMGDALLEEDIRLYTVLAHQLSGHLMPLRLIQPADLAIWESKSSQYQGRERLRRLGGLLQSQRNAVGRQMALVDRSLEVLLPERAKPSVQMSRW
jgi:hypothetical protein